jgi:hypothetical protein
MRYVLLLKGDPGPADGPDPTIASALGSYVGELARAGVLLAADGFQPSSTGARVRFAGSGHSVVDGPFADSRGLVAGYILIDVRSREEAIEWASRCPIDIALGEGETAEVEVRGVVQLAGAR